jgi:hypothetical protein
MTRVEKLPNLKQDVALRDVFATVSNIASRADRSFDNKAGVSMLDMLLHGDRISAAGNRRAGEYPRSCPKG